MFHHQRILLYKLELVISLLLCYLEKVGYIVFLWGCDGKLGHQTNPTDLEPHPLFGPLDSREHTGGANYGRIPLPSCFSMPTH